MNPPGTYLNNSGAPPYPQSGFGGSFQPQQPGTGAYPSYPSGPSPYPPMQQGGGAAPYPPMQHGGGAAPYPPMQSGAGASPYPPMQPGPGGAAPYPPMTASAYPTANTQQQPQGPTAPMPDGPPPDWKGEILNFDPQIQPPTNPFWNPNFDDTPPYNPPTIETKQTEISSEEVRLALEEYANKKCCYGKPTNITIGEIVMENVFKYELDTTTEMRKTQWKFEPYISQGIPGPAPVPNAWDIPVTIDAPFKEGKKHVQIPGTASVRPCQKCWGGGRSRCTHCAGMGFKNCTWCNGSGRRFDDACSSCNARGRDNCTWCHGQGTDKCMQCQGRGQVFAYLELVVSWKVHTDEFITEENSSRGGLVVPKKKLSGCAGKNVYEDTRDRLFPLTNFPSGPITEASRRLLESHNKLQTNDVLIRQQKHLVEVIPIASVEYTCKGKNGIYRVYGQNHKVFFPDYPNSGCCSIV